MCRRSRPSSATQAPRPGGRAGAVVGTLVLLALLWTGPALREASAHPNKLPPPVDVTCDVTAKGIQITVLVQRPLLDAWLREHAGHAEPEKVTHAQLESFLRETLTLAFEERPVLLTLAKHTEMPAYLNPSTGDPIPAAAVFTLTGAVPFGDTPRLRSDGAPRLPDQARMTWARYEGVDWEGDNEVPGLIDAREGEHYVGISNTLFTPDETELFWHRTESHPFQFQTVAVEPGQPPDRIPVPILSILFGMAGLAVTLTARSVAPLIRLAPLLVGVGVGLGVRDVWVYEYTVPDTGTQVLPSESKAKAIFQQLQDNIYTAFRKEDEELAYDLIAASVEDPLVRPLYAEIYKSLIMQDQSGVLTRITELEHVAGEVELPEDSWSRHFNVTWQWRATGVFAHQGHTHTRINEYKARYLLRESGGSWKIAHIEVLEHRRRDDDKAPERLDPETGLVLPDNVGTEEARDIEIEVGGMVEPGGDR